MGTGFACGLEPAGKVWGRTSNKVQRLHHESIALSSHNQDRRAATQHDNFELPCALTSEWDLQTPPAPLQRTLPSPSCCGTSPAADASQTLQHHDAGH